MIGLGGLQTQELSKDYCFDLPNSQYSSLRTSIYDIGSVCFIFPSI